MANIRIAVSNAVSRARIAVACGGYNRNLTIRFAGELLEKRFIEAIFIEELKAQLGKDEQ